MSKDIIQEAVPSVAMPSQPKEIPASVMLDDMDVRYDRYGKRRFFSIKFVSLTGKLYYVPKAYCQGAGKMDNKRYRMRGIQPCCASGNPEGHPYPVRITNIIEYNGHPVVWS